MKYDLILKGDIIYCDEQKKMHYLPSSYLSVKDGKIENVSSKANPKEAKEYLDCTGKLILPGLSDLHAHASQYMFVGLGEDCELLDWLKLHAYEEESKFAFLAYAREAYSYFARDLRRSFTTRASLFTTVHKDATYLLMQLLEEAKIPCYVGKVNMDRDAAPALTEDTETSLKETEELIQRSKDFSLEHYIITPRFVPACSDELMDGLGKLSLKYQVAVQSHLDENPSEIALVKELEKNDRSYSDVYYRNHLFGNPNKTIMAHCIWEDEQEIEMLKENNVYVAHCPDSNLNVASGIAPIRRYLKEGIKIGLGSDVSGGSSLNLFYAMREAIQVSKMRFRYIDPSAMPLNIEEAFYLATISGGSFFGKVGSFLKGYDADILVIDDSRLDMTLKMSLKDRLERFIYRGEESDLKLKFIQGEKISLD